MGFAWGSLWVILSCYAPTADVISRHLQRMQSLLRDFLLSYCPAAVRRTLPPESTLRALHAATWGGLAQLLLAGLVFLIRLQSYFVVRGHQLAPQIAGSNETVQAGITVIVALEFLIHPLSLFLLYLAVEGLVRFVGGLITSEIVPSLFVSLGFRAVDSFSRSREQRRSGPFLADIFEHMPDNRIRIASSSAKAGWTASITIGIGGQWFEVEREENGPSPRSFIYILRPAHPGKVLRGYQEYDAISALSANATQGPSQSADAIESRK